MHPHFQRVFLITLYNAYTPIIGCDHTRAIVIALSPLKVALIGGKEKNKTPIIALLNTGHYGILCVNQQNCNM